MSKSLGFLTHFMKRQEGIINYDFRSNLYRERLRSAKNLYKKDLISHFGCVNAIEFSREGDFLVSGGDDRRVLLWNVEKSMEDKEEPRAMEKQHLSNIFCLGFNSDNTKIFSGGNDDTVMVHDTKTGDLIDVFPHEKPVYGLSIDPMNDQIFATSGEDGRILIFDLRACSDVMCAAKYKNPFHAVMFHPVDGGFLISANAKEGAGLWDLRKPKSPALRYGGANAAQNCMSVRFNTLGTSILALRRRLPPILYSTFSEEAICQFYHPDYYNSCTMKSCCFAGESDEYVLSGSDDFNLYAWRINDADISKKEQWIESSHMVLCGHRSIVNQVRYNAHKCLIASSGVEKVIKLWSPFAKDKWSGSLTEEIYEQQRSVYSHDQYLSLMNISIQNMTHDYSNQNTNEDPRMMAFFDSLVQQEIETWNSPASSDSDQSTQHTSDDMSDSCQTSIQSSDNESIASYGSENNNRGNDNANKAQARSYYPNRIAYLIATKRNVLKRLAMKGHTNSATNTSKSTKYGNRKTKRMSLRNIRKVGGKRRGRYNAKKSTKSRQNTSSREGNSDSEVQTKKMLTKRRTQHQLQYTASYHRSFRNRKCKIITTNNSNIPSSTLSTSNNNNNGNTQNNINTSSSGTSRIVHTKPPSSSDDDDDSVPTRSNNGYLQGPDRGSAPQTDLNVPSTSTGITANGKRLVFHKLSSDDEPIARNALHSNKYSNRNKINDIYSSHSNSRLSNSSCQDDGTSNDSYSSEYFTKRRKLSHQVVVHEEDIEEELEINEEIPAELLHNDTLEPEDNVTVMMNGDHETTTAIPTPQKCREMYNYTPDSGIATTVCSSSGSVTNNNNNNDPNTPSLQNGNSNLSHNLLSKRLSRVRRNYRNKFGDDDNDTDDDDDDDDDDSD